MWLQMLSPGLPFQPSVGALISLPLQLPNSQIRLTWLPVGQQLWDFNLRTFLLDPITQLYYMMCLLVGHVPSYLSPSAAVFFYTLHGLSHPGVRATRKLVARKYVWHGLGRQVGEWAKSCIACQRTKVNFHHRAPLCKYNEPLLRFNHVNVNLVGPLPPSKGFTHLLTVVDRVTRWPEAIPLASINTKDVAEAFLNGWITRYGLPSDVSSDRGPQFTSLLWQDLSDLLGTKLHHTTAYHPQANDLVERFHRSMKVSLRARCQSTSWISELPWVMLGLRTMPKDT